MKDNAQIKEMENKIKVASDEVLWIPLVDAAKKDGQIIFAQCCKPGPCSPK